MLLCLSESEQVLFRDIYTGVLFHAHTCPLEGSVTLLRHFINRYGKKNRQETIERDEAEVGHLHWDDSV